MRSRPAVLAALSLLLVSACGGNSSDKDDTGDAADPGQPFAGVEFKGDFGAEPTVTVKDLAVDKLATAVLSEGDGPTVSADQSALIQLQVYSGADGTVLYSTWQAKRPSTVGPDNPPLFEGLRAAIDGQPRGSRVVLETPAADAVGAENVPKLGLKADDALVAVADILSIQDPEPLSGPDGTAVKAPGGAPKVKAKGDDVTGFDWSGVGAKPTKLQVIPLVEGDGPAIQANRLVTFNYFGEVFKGKSRSTSPTPPSRSRSRSAPTA